MTVLFRTKTSYTGPSPFTSEDVLHPTKKDASDYATVKRKDGITTTITEVDLKKVGTQEQFTSKQLFCALFNRQGYVATEIPVKTVPGIKSAQ